MNKWNSLISILGIYLNPEILESISLLRKMEYIFFSLISAKDPNIDSVSNEMRQGVNGEEKQDLDNPILYKHWK